MTRWHTDAPIRPVRRVRALTPSPAIDMFQSSAAARQTLRAAQAYWRRKLRNRPRAAVEDAQGDDGHAGGPRFL